LGIGIFLPIISLIWRDYRYWCGAGVVLFATGGWTVWNVFAAILACR
jgi:hypothetical protein